MKKQLLLLLVFLLPHLVPAQDPKTSVRELAPTGKPNFRNIRDLYWQLNTLDLSGITSTELPANALHSRHRLQRLTLPAGLKSIGSAALFACDSLASLTLPASLEKLGTSALAQCTRLRVLKVQAPQPPKADISAFYGIPEKCRLEVPAGSEQLYRQAEGWKRFYGTTDTPAEREVCRPAECLLPMPAGLYEQAGTLPLEVKGNWSITASEGLDNEVQRAREVLEACEGISLGKKGGVELSLRLNPAITGTEAYHLDVTKQGIKIEAATPQGVFYGLMTLRRLLLGSGRSTCVDAIPQLTINDRPRTSMRELMVDPARIFLPLNDLKKFVVEMAYSKYNALHLHLVDDQAWRIEIKRYPRLTQEASSRVGMDDMQMPISGYYTQEQMRDLVAFAARYHVEIIPEIEMPGHEVAAISVYPELTCGQKKVPIRLTCGVSNELLCPASEFVYEFLGNVFAELAEVFPSKYIHLGGDEAGTPALDCWTRCPECQKLKKRLGISPVDRREDNWQLQEYMFGRVIDTLRTKYGKVPMFWYETDFKRIPEGCITFAWRHGLTRAAIEAAQRNNADILLCPGEHCYLDYPMAPGDMPEKNWGMPVTSLRQTYRLDPSWGMGPGFENHNLRGVAGTLWSECINTPERLFYQAYPRAFALAEVGWSPADKRSEESFFLRLPALLRDMQRRGVAHSVAF